MAFPKMVSQATKCYVGFGYGVCHFIVERVIAKSKSPKQQTIFLQMHVSHYHTKIHGFDV